MTFNLRYYQREAIDAVYSYWRGGGGNALIELATGTGKSGVAGTFCKELLGGWPDLRIGVIAHVKELIQQNAQEMFRIWPQAPIGIYSAGLGKRDTRAQILFGGIQSIHRKAEVITRGFDVLLIDEAHLIPRDSETMYGRFIDRCRDKVPDMRIVGLTATPYRLGSGRLDEGEGRIFDSTVYSYDIGAGVRDGYLCPLTSKRTQGEVDLKGVAVRGGEYVAGELERAMMRDADKITEACAEIIAFGRQQRRRKWIVFCTGVAHSAAVCAEMGRQGVLAASVTGETPAAERDRLIRLFREGQLECLTSVGVLTTGFNVPDVDLIALMRPTLSTGLYVQMLGRGTRPIYERGFDMETPEGRRQAVAASHKPNCLVLDYAGNGETHGPVDALTPPAAPESRGKREQIEKITVETVKGKYCPNCGELCLVQAATCEDCGHNWPVEIKHDARAGDMPVMASEQRPEWHAVTHWDHKRHEKAGGTPSFRIDYLCGMARYSDWLCFEHTGGARDVAHKKWDELRGEMPAPAAVDEALERADELMRPSEIMIARDGQFWRIVAKRFGSPPPPPNWGAAPELDDEIPF